MKRLLIGLLVLGGTATAEAHRPSDSYLALRVEGARVEARWDIALRDLEHAIGLDGDGDGAITWGELRSRHDAISAYALARLRLDADGAACAGRPADHLVDRRSDGTYAVLRFDVDCPAAPRALGLRYDLFAELDPRHRGVVHVDGGGAARTLVVGGRRSTEHVELASAGAWQTIADFWRDGVWHIWVGFDHILFLLALLLPAVLRRDAAGGWHAVGGFGEAFGETLKVVTAFTVAHSITLTLAALGAIHLPSRLVESAIAASVVLAAVNNAFPLFSERRWLFAFGFGLLHGFGFASVLAEPGLPTTSLVLALLGFNAGVESGQIAIVAAFLPLAYLARRSWAYQRFTLVGGSCAVAVLALVWLLERALDLSLLPS